MKMFRTLALVLLLSVGSQATTYFVKAAGADTNTGLSDAQAWAHSPGMTGCASTCLATTLVAGDTVLLNNGDTFRASEVVPTSGSLAAGFISWGSYGQTSAVNPRITGADVMSSFSNGGSNIWDKTGVTTQPATVIINNQKGTKVGSRAACTAPGNWFWVANTLSVFATSDPSGTVEAGQRNIVFDLNSKDYIAVTNITLDAANTQDYYLRGAGAGSHVIVSGVVAKWSAFQGYLIRNIIQGYFSNDDAIANGQTGGWQADSADSNLTFARCSASLNIGQGFDFEDAVNVTFLGGPLASTSFGNGSATIEGNGINIAQNVGFQPSAYFYIYDFYSHDNFGNGLDVISATGSRDIGNHDINVIGGRYSGAKASLGLESGIRLDQDTYNSTVAYARADHNNSGGIVNEVQSHNNTIIYNLLDHNTRGLTLSNGPGCSTVILGNVAVFNTDSGFSTSGGTCQSTFRNNIMAFNTNYGYDTDNAFAFDLDYDLVFGNGIANYHFVSPPAHDVNLDPQFINAAANDYRLRATSPGINAGQAQTFPYRLGLSPMSAYSFIPVLADQFQFGNGTNWTIGAYVNNPLYQPMDGRAH